MRLPVCMVIAADTLAQYAGRRPEQTALYELIQQHAATFFAQAQDALVRYVKDAFDTFLECGLLAHDLWIISFNIHCPNKPWIR